MTMTFFHEYLFQKFLLNFLNIFCVRSKRPVALHNTETTTTENMLSSEQKKEYNADHSSQYMNLLKHFQQQKFWNWPNRYCQKTSTTWSLCLKPKFKISNQIISFVLGTKQKIFTAESAI